MAAALIQPDSSHQMKDPLNSHPLLQLTAAAILLTTSGCVVAEPSRHAHYRNPPRYEHPPHVIVHAPEIVIPAVRIRVD